MEPPITYRGALQLWGKHDPQWLAALDGLLGGAILASVAIAPVSALFGLVDQKNEAMGLLRKGYGAAKDRLLKTGSHERQHLATAAHTIVVLASFFDALREDIGNRNYKSFEFTDEDKIRRLAAADQDDSARRIDTLYRAEVPTPSVECGFEENLPRLRTYYLKLAESTLEFAEKLAAGRSVPSPRNAQYVGALAELSVARYVENYLKLAADVPEFRFFAELKEFGATRHEIRSVATILKSLQEQVIQQNAHILHSHSNALAALEARLRDILPRDRPAAARVLDVLRVTNAGTLEDPILPYEQLHDIPDLRSPVIGDIYVEPHFRASTYSRGGRPTEEKWWHALPRRHDISLFFASYFASPVSAERPLLILGDPGAGKSLLTRILAARLPAEAYVAVRVPLREVGADLPLHRQIEESLTRATHNRISWREVNDATESRMRVLLFDGLDELLQASQTTHADFLEKVVEFQRQEARLGQPTAALVTSRTVVANRVSIPPGTSIIHLEHFDDSQVTEWLSGWRNVNRALARDEDRLLSPSAALRQRELARQPLLLMMLAVYQSDPTTKGLKAEMSTGELYKAVVENFLSREARKHAGSAQNPASLLAQKTWQLSVTAFSMFNRGQQSIMDEEIGSDLRALEGAPRGTEEERIQLGQQSVGGFFFIHTAQAGDQDGRRVRRSYEFLHATFGEFIVAQQTITFLSSMVSSHQAGEDLDDRMPAALLSHRPLATRSSIANFVEDLLPRGDERREPIGAAITTLLRNIRKRPIGPGHGAYHPTPDDYVTRLATYSANLVLLRVYLAGNGVPIAELAPSDEAWRSLVRLWWSGLDGDGWSAQVQALDTNGQTRAVFPRNKRNLDVARPVIGYAQLIGDAALEEAITTGYTELRFRNRRPDLGSDR